MSSSTTTPTAPTTRRSRGGIRRIRSASSRLRWSVFWSWAALTGLVLYVEFAFWTRALHPPFTPVGLLLVTMVASVVCGLWNATVIGRKQPRRAVLGVVLTLVPVALLAWPLAYSAARWTTRESPKNRLFNFATAFGAAVMHAEAARKYPNRLESTHLVMLYDDRVKTPQADLNAMDAHVARLERLLHRKLRDKIWWVRGSVFGQARISFLGLSLGSEVSPAAEQTLDRHELAHGVIEQFRLAESDPPALLSEGWAEAHSGPQEWELAEVALVERTRDPSLTVRNLVSTEWYYRHDGPVYRVGGAFCGYLIRRFGARTFLDLYVRAGPKWFVNAALLILGVDFDTIERDFWRDAERLAPEAE